MALRWTFILTIALVLCSPTRASASAPWVPQLKGRVTDIAKVLSDTDRERLTDMLRSYEEETSHQIAILIIPTLSSENIESFSLRVANSWGLGQKDINNGILATLAMKEKKIRIELGLGMARFISDATAQAKINNSMFPAFRKGDYAIGLEDGLQRLMEEGRSFVASNPRKIDIKSD